MKSLAIFLREMCLLAIGQQRRVRIDRVRKVAALPHPKSLSSQERDFEGVTAVRDFDALTQYITPPLPPLLFPGEGAGG